MAVSDDVRKSVQAAVPPHTSNRAAVRLRARIAVLLTCIGAFAACDPVTPPNATSHTTPTATVSPPRPCTFLTQQSAAAISGDAAVTNQALNVFEPIYGYVACIYSDPQHEANSVSVQIKSTPNGVDASALQQAATFFEGGEPVQPYASFAVPGVGESALGEAIPGVAFIVFVTRDLLVYVGAFSASLSPSALRGGVENLAEQVAAAL